MASIKIHQDLFNFERKRGGFTARQRHGLAAAAVAGVASTALFGYVLELPLTVAGLVALVAATVVLVPAFVPWWGMPMEEAVARFSAQQRRGPTVPYESDGPGFDTTEGRTSRAYARRIAKKGCERDLGR